MIEFVLALFRSEDFLILVGILVSLRPTSEEHVPGVTEVEDTEVRVSLVQETEYEGARACLLLSSFLDAGDEQVPQADLPAPHASLAPALVPRLDSVAEVARVDARVDALVIPATYAIRDRNHIVRDDPRVFTSSVALLVVRDVRIARG